MSDVSQLYAAVCADPTDETARLAYADALEEIGARVMPHVFRAQVRFGLPFCNTASRDVAVKALRTDADWREAFGQGTGGNTAPKADACPPGSDVDLTPPTVEDVVDVIAAAGGENDGDHWVGVFLLRDGRYALVDAWCDNTGWDCRADNNVEVATTFAALAQLGLDRDTVRRLWSPQ